MADSKISELTALTTPASDDVLAIVDTSAGVTKKITISNLATSSEVVDDTTPQLGGDLASNGSDILFADNDKAKFGTGNDLEIYHDGSHSYIQDTGTGHLRLAGDDLQIVNAAINKNYIICANNGAVDIYHAGIKKFETTSSGIDVTGTVTADGLTVDNITINGEEIESSGGMLLDIAGNLNIDVDGTTITLADGGVNFGQFYNNASGTFNIVSPTQDKDIVFRGNDGGSGIVALTLDMSDGGTATFNNKVGIGTTSPTGALDVKSGTQPQLKVATASATADRNAGFLVTASNSATAGSRSVVVSLDADGGDGSGTDNLTITKTGGGGNATITNQNNAGLVFGTNNAEKMRLTSTGLGIGTTSPNSIFEVRDDASPTIRVTDGDANNITHMQADGANGGYFGTLTSHDVRIAPNNSTKLIVKVDGKVGIGETSPLGNLHVKSADSGASAHASADEVVIEGSANSGINILSGNNSEGAIYFGDDGDNNIGSITYTHNNNNLHFDVNASRRMTIDSSGNVGIGTSSINVITQAGGSGYRVLQLENNDGGQINLDHTDAGTGSTLGMINFNRAGETVAHIGGVTDGATDSGQINFRTQPASGALTERMRITSAGKVGIGDIAPDTLLHVNQGGEPPAEGMLILEANSASRQLRIQPPTNADNGFIDFRGGNLAFLDDGTEVARFQGTTGFGIGTSSPSSTLHIKSGGDTVFIIQGGATDANTSVQFRNSGGTERGRILYDTDDNTLQFKVNTTEHFRIAANGDLTATDTSIGSNSDSRLKQNIADYTYDISKFKQFKAKTFDWKNPTQHNNKTGNRGFIAQEVAAIDDYWTDQISIDPDTEDAKLIDADSNGKHIAKTLKLGKKDAMYISVIQQLIARIEALENN